MNQLAIDLYPAPGHPSVPSHPKFRRTIRQAQGSNPSLRLFQARGTNQQPEEQQHVTYLTDRIGDGEEEDEQYADHGRRLGPHAEPVARADGLRNDLREEEEEPNQMVAQFIHQEANGGELFFRTKGRRSSRNRISKWMDEWKQVEHLAEREDERDGDEDGDVGRHERVEEYGQRLHGERVADEERAEEQVLVLHDGEDPGCAPRERGARATRDTHSLESE